MTTQYLIEQNEAGQEDEEQIIEDCEEYSGPGEQEVEKPSKDEYKVAKWMKKNVKTKKTKFLSHNVEYFTSSKAIDALLKSKFAQGDQALFLTREHIVEFLDRMLEHKFYHRAKKVPVSLEELRGGSAAGGKKTDATTTSTSSSGKTGKEETAKKDEKPSSSLSTTASSNSSKRDTDKKDTEAEEQQNEGSGDGNKKEKRKRKIRLDMHPEQVFVDGSEAYVWIYDPIPIHYWIYGLVLLLGAIGICLFPLWPPMLRKGVYYLSVAAAGFLVFILALTVVRLIIFTIVWAVTAGKLHFWIFPNLTEDVGFFASFWPLYESKFVAESNKDGDGKRSKSKSKRKEKDSDNEDEMTGEAEPLKPEKIEEIKEHDAEIELRRRKFDDDGGTSSSTGVVDTGDKMNSDEADENRDTEEESHSSGGDNSEAAAESDAKCSHTASESESEISGKDYEIINSSEVQNVN